MKDYFLRLISTIYNIDIKIKGYNIDMNRNIQEGYHKQIILCLSKFNYSSGTFIQSGRIVSISPRRHSAILNASSKIWSSTRLIVGWILSLLNKHLLKQNSSMKLQTFRKIPAVPLATSWRSHSPRNYFWVERLFPCLSQSATVA